MSERAAIVRENVTKSIVDAKRLVLSVPITADVKLALMEKLSLTSRFFRRSSKHRIGRRTKLLSIIKNVLKIMKMMSKRFSTKSIKLE